MSCGIMDGMPQGGNLGDIHQLFQIGNVNIVAAELDFINPAGGDF